MVAQQKALSLALSSQRSQDNRTITSPSDITDDMHYVAHLLNLGQTFCEHPRTGVLRLCQEIQAITQERAHLHLCQLRGLHKSFSSPTFATTLSVHFKHRSYGTLCVTYDPVDAKKPALPLSIAQILAQTCSWLLYTIELSALLQGQCQQLHYQVQGLLTRREREVLNLMSRGYSQESIAEELSIASATVHKHRQHIYEQLGVHNERDAILAAFHAGILSFIEDNTL